MIVRLLISPLKVWKLLATALLLCGLNAVGANAQSIEAFYKGKTVTLVEWSVPGSPYDTYARLLALFLPKHIPGHPAVLVKNMPGAGGLVAARYMYDVAPKDGTTIGDSSQTLIFEPLLGDNVGNLDYHNFGWLGSMSQSTAVYVSWKSSRIKTANDLFEHELLIPGTGAASETTVVTSVLNAILGTKIKVVQGYAGSPAALLALEQGEVEGGFPTLQSLKTLHPDWLRDDKLNLLFQTRQVPDPELAQVPTAISLAKTDEQRRALQFMFPRDTIGRPFLTPPGLNEDRLKALQDAFEATVQDPELVSEAAKTRIPIELTRGEELAKIVDEAYATPVDIVEQVRRAVLSIPK